MAGQFPDLAQVGGAGGLEAAFGGLAGGAGAGERGFGLGDVRPGDFADAEAVVGGLELAGEHLLVVEVELEDLLGLDDADEGVDGVGKDLLFGGEQAGALTEDAVIGLFGGGAGAAAGVDLLGCGCGAGRGCRGCCG